MHGIVAPLLRMVGTGRVRLWRPLLTFALALALPFAGPAHHARADRPYHAAAPGREVAHSLVVAAGYEGVIDPFAQMPPPELEQWPEQETPVNKPATTLQPAPGVRPTPVAQPAPATQPAPVIRPAPGVQPAPATQPVPVIRPAPATQPAPAIRPAPGMQPAPATQPAPVIQPEPATQPAPGVQPAPAVQPEAVADPPAEAPPVQAAASPAAPAAPPVRLFGTVEFRSPIKNLPKWERVRDAEAGNPSFTAAGLATNNEKVAQRWAKIKAENKNAPLREKIQNINNFFNQWPYRMDIGLWGVEDYWATPREFVQKSGDCEDYAIAKYYALRDLGVPAANMRVAAVRDSIRGLGHAVLIVFVDGDAYVLDNLTNLVLSHKKLSHYAVQYTVNEEFLWRHVKPKNTPGNK